MLMIFTLGRTDVLPVDDLGIKKGIQRSVPPSRNAEEGEDRTTCKKLAPLLLGCVTLPLAAQGLFLDADQCRDYPTDNKNRKYQKYCETLSLHTWWSKALRLLKPSVILSNLGTCS